MMSDVRLLFAFVLLIVVAIALVVAVTSAIRSHRGRNASGGTPTCGHCGYNLTGAPGNRCPECGQLFIEAGVTFRFRDPPGRLTVTSVIAIVLFGLVVLVGVIGMDTYNAARARAAKAQAAAARNAAIRQARQAQGGNQPPGPAARQPERLSPIDAGDNGTDSQPGDAPASRPSF